MKWFINLFIESIEVIRVIKKLYFIIMIFLRLFKFFFCSFINGGRLYFYYMIKKS